ncbi:hypothetical protein LFM09_17925 [Lentzea alba]|uniref:hypothetical protein n=1 Tax=Lentzea alba TaxID=2714351 RepID=UPI0039BF8FB0
MGASGWLYYTEFDPNPMAVLTTLHCHVLASREYLWGDDAPWPSTLQELHELYMEHERLAEQGTHSILDIWQVGTRDDIGTILPLPANTVRTVFGGGEPTKEQFEAAYETDALHDFPRGSGRFTTLFEDGKPAEIAVWGVSGD